MSTTHVPLVFWSINFPKDFMIFFFSKKYQSLIIGFIMLGIEKKYLSNNSLKLLKYVFIALWFTSFHFGNLLLLGNASWQIFECLIDVIT